MARRPTTIHVISHTHWDREWYRTQQQFRLELVDTIDAALDALAEDERFRCFMLDGQTILIDDYVGLRREREPELRQRVAERRLLIGPWYTQPDEFIVSGESLVRNLLVGIAGAEHYGASMRVGWGRTPSVIPLNYRKFSGSAGSKARS